MNESVSVFVKIVRLSYFPLFCELSNQYCTCRWSKFCSKPDVMNGFMITCLQSQPDRTNDKVYEWTTSVVRAVMTMTKEAPSVEPEGYLAMVRVSCFPCSLQSVSCTKGKHMWLSHDNEHSLTASLVCRNSTELRAWVLCVGVVLAGLVYWLVC